MKEKICGTIAIIAFFWLLGIAGNSDLGLSTTGEVITQGGAALALFAGSLYAGGFLGGRPPARGGRHEDRR